MEREAWLRESCCWRWRRRRCCHCSCARTPPWCTCHINSDSARCDGSTSPGSSSGSAPAPGPATQTLCRQDTPGTRLAHWQHDWLRRALGGHHGACSRGHRLTGLVVCKRPAALPVACWPSWASAAIGQREHCPAGSEGCGAYPKLAQREHCLCYFSGNTFLVKALWFS